jgi:D-isomer specific 2-hydroxyacid dehydrogenase, NAD binding domain/Protein of unknown function (DUF3489)
VEWLPGTTAISKFKDRKTAAQRLWTAFTQLPVEPEPITSSAKPPARSKQAQVIGLLQRPQGATIDEIATVMRWQINLARGPIADEEALYHAMRDGVIGGAALDTWWRYPSAGDPQPCPSRYTFHELPNVIMTPHTDGTIERRSRDVACNIDRFARGEPLENIVAIT